MWSCLDFGRKKCIIGAFLPTSDALVLRESNLFRTCTFTLKYWNSTMLANSVKNLLTVLPRWQLWLVHFKTISKLALWVQEIWSLSQRFFYCHTHQCFLLLHIYSYTIQLIYRHFSRTLNKRSFNAEIARWTINHPYVATEMKKVSVRHFPQSLFIYLPHPIRSTKSLHAIARSLYILVFCTMSTKENVVLWSLTWISSDSHETSHADRAPNPAGW